MLAPEGSHEEDGVKPLRIGILISGRGSNCMAIVRSIAEGRLTGCEVGLVVSNIPGAAGIDSVKAYGIPIITLEGRGSSQRDHEEAVSALLRKFRIDLVCLAGYRRILSNLFIREWPHRIVNVHASLLPAFPGRDPSTQALDFGAQITGCTVYFVEEAGFGPIIVQRAVPVLDEDEERDVFRRLLPEQHIAYVEAIRRIVSGDYEIVGKRYKLIPPPAVTELEEEQPVTFGPGH